MASMDRAWKAASPPLRAVALRPTSRDLTSDSEWADRAVVASPTIIRRNQALVELALQITDQVRATGSPRRARQAARLEWRRLVQTIAVSIVAGLLLAVAIWTGPMLLQAVVRQLTLSRSPAIALPAKATVTASPTIHPGRAPFAPPGATGADAFGVLRIHQPQWSMSAATAAANTAAAVVRTTVPPQDPEAMSDTTASIVPRQLLHGPETGRAAAPIATAVPLPAKPATVTAHRPRRTKHRPAATKIAPAAAAPPPPLPLPAVTPDPPIPTTSSNVTGPPGSSR
jgi:hypothetical protein